MIETLNFRELVLYVDNKPSATPLERLLADRLDAVLMQSAALVRENESLKGQIDNFEDDYK